MQSKHPAFVCGGGGGGGFIHLSSSRATLRRPDWAGLLPHQLIVKLREAGIRSADGSFARPRHIFESPDTPADKSAFEPKVEEEGEVEPLRPKPRSDNVPMILGDRLECPVPRGLTPDDFVRARVFVGNFVITRAASKCELSRANPRLRGLPFWVFLVRHHTPPGEQLSHNTRKVGSMATDVYESQLYAPAGQSSDMRSCLVGLYHATAPKEFLLTAEEKIQKRRRDQGIETPEEKRRRKERRRHDDEVHGPRLPPQGPMQVPVVAFLRPENLIGGGFFVTSSGRIPGYVLTYLREVAGFDV